MIYNYYIMIYKYIVLNKSVAYIQGFFKIWHCIKNISDKIDWSRQLTLVKIHIILRNDLS